MALRFGEFTLDLETGELRKHGSLVKLKPQPAQVLALLTSRAGTVVTREEIQEALWPDDTYVDFDLGINSCIRQIRIALGDDADAPRYVQTLSRRGYRFIASLEREDIGDGRVETEDALAGDSGETHGRRLAASRRALPWGIAAIFVLAAVFFAGRDTSQERRVFRSEISAPSGTRFHLESANPGAPALSPDGRMLAFSARDGNGNVVLHVRALNAAAARALSGAERAEFPFWSPDSRWIGFFADGQLKKIQAEGGATQTLCDADAGKGGSWNRDDVIVFAPAPLGPLHRVSSTGGASTPITELDDVRGDNSHRIPRFLPDGRRFLYLARNRAGAESTVVLVGSLDGGESTELLHSPVAADYSSGHLLFLRGGSLVAQSFDTERLSLTGEATSIADEVRAISAAGLGVFTASQNSELIYLAGKPSVGSVARLEWVDRAGKSQGFLGDSAAQEQVFPSPDGQQVAVPYLRLGWNPRRVDLRHRSPEPYPFHLRSRHGAKPCMVARRGRGLSRRAERSFRPLLEDGWWIGQASVNI